MPIQPTINTSKSKPPYLLGLICLIPLLGAMAGLVILILGIVKYKDKWFSIIGVAGIAWTVFLYSALFYAGTHAAVFKDGFKEISQMQLNRLVKDVEFYKLLHGDYPDKLQQLLDDDKMANIVDPVQGMNMNSASFYNYEKNGDKYALFSSGQDGKPNTKDDLYPQITLTDISKIGLVINK